jgi:hypothetical protein
MFEIQMQHLGDSRDQGGSRGQTPVIMECPPVSIEIMTWSTTSFCPTMILRSSWSIFFTPFMKSFDDFKFLFLFNAQFQGLPQIIFSNSWAGSVVTV